MQPIPMVRLRMYLHEQAHTGGSYHTIIAYLRKARVGGAVALRGLEGFGRNGHLQHGSDLDSTLDLPVILEVVATRETADALMANPDFIRLLNGALVTRDDVERVN